MLFAQMYIMGTHLILLVLRFAQIPLLLMLAQIFVKIAMFSVRIVKIPVLITTNFYLMNDNECLLNCTDNQYKNLDDQKCYSICPNGYYGNSFNFTCVQNCPNGMFITDKFCDFCSFDCKTCMSSFFYCNICK